MSSACARIPCPLPAKSKQNAIAMLLLEIIPQI
jgi:hypothetical protein